MPETNRVLADEKSARKRSPSAPGGGFQELSGRRVAILGPGRVGQSMAFWLLEKGGRVTVWGRRRCAGIDALERQGASFALLDRLQDGPAADLYIVAVSDEALEAVARLLSRSLEARRSRSPHGESTTSAAVALHVSGSRDREALSSMRAAGVAVGSFHPLKAFAGVSRSADEARGVTFAIDGDPPALLAARDLGLRLGGRVVELSGDRRVLYHLAACFAAGGVVTILAAVDRLREIAELPSDLLTSYLHLTRGALDQVPTDGPPVAAAITGPAARGDLQLLERQRAAVERAAPELVGVLDALNTLTDLLRSDVSTAPKG